jgi:putative transcriptional regulator
MESLLDITGSLVYDEMESLLVISTNGRNVKNRLEELRKKAGITQEELADRLEVSRQTIGSLESGRYNPSIQLAFKLAKFFSVTIEDMFLYEEE